MGKHTLVLLQGTASNSSRTYYDYETVAMALDGICRMYEQRLKQVNPGVQNITYDVTDLYTFIDQLYDLTCLVFNPSLNAYVPNGKDWIKQRIYQHLSQQAGLQCCERACDRQ
eukprot:TRINITY_DN4301_c0_g1_i1.p3 TRINITY_DN4301_c0_g1~~TRINITY_DN4301_c0_g1_i1.p3  ORF type:complete len:113 (+),score=15.98 TRINITY_DN4301_c0_g1_i1:128-466(+)